MLFFQLCKKSFRYMRSLIIMVSVYNQPGIQNSKFHHYIDKQFCVDFLSSAFCICKMYERNSRIHGQ